MASLFLILVAAAPAGAATKTVFVNVNTGVNDVNHGTLDKPYKTIKYALSRVTGDAVINIAAGTYNENLYIDKNKITLHGDNRTTTFIKGAATSPTIALFGAQMASINGLNISIGREGISAGGSTFEVQNCIVETSRGDGITIRSNSAAKIFKSIVRKNAFNGVSASGNASVFLDGCNIASNSGAGVSFYGNTSGGLVGCNVVANGQIGVNIGINSCAGLDSCTIKNNQREGVWVTQNSSATLMSNTITANQQSGLDVNMSSCAFLRGENVISLNGDPSKPEAWRVGIGIHFSSMVSISPNGDFPKDQIIGNNGAGIFMGGLCNLMMPQGLIDNNRGDGIVMMFTSSAQFGTGGVLPEDAQITRNDGWGIKCRDQSHDSKYAGTPYFGTQAQGNLNKLGNRDCQTYY